MIAMISSILTAFYFQGVSPMELLGDAFIILALCMIQDGVVIWLLNGNDF